MWKITKEGAINLGYARRIFIQKAQWIYNKKDYSCAVGVEFSDNEKRTIEFFEEEKAANAYVAELIDELNKSAGVLIC